MFEDCQGVVPFGVPEPVNCRVEPIQTFNVPEIVGSGLTVNCTGVVATDSHEVLPNVEIVIRLYWVVAVNPAGGSYDDNVAPPMVDQAVNGLTALSQR